MGQNQAAPSAQPAARSRNHQLEFLGRCVANQRFFVASFPGVEAELWEHITTGNKRISVACVFFPDGNSTFFGKHRLPCVCRQWYSEVHPEFHTWTNGQAPFGCLWSGRWHTLVEECISQGQVPVVVYQRGKLGDAAGLGYSQVGERKRLLDVGQKLFECDIDIFEKTVLPLVANVKPLPQTGPPQTLHAISPTANGHCAGEFHLKPGLMANGFPVWHKENPSRWLYTGNNGQWYVTKDDDVAGGKNFDTDRGFLTTVGTHGGVLPHEQKLKWEAYKGGAWHTDSTVKFSLQCLVHPPQTLHAISLTSNGHCAGDFHLKIGLMANGFPVWQKDNPSRWLYTGNNGQWYVTHDDDVAGGKNFATDRGFLTTISAHGGVLPHEEQKFKWEAYKGGAWHTDSTVKFSLQRLVHPPQTVHAISRTNHGHCAGDFHLKPGLMANGFPVWHKENPSRWLYTGNNGQWYVTHDDDVAGGKNFATDRGFLTTICAHGGVLPHEEQKLKWEVYKGGAWHTDNTIKFVLK